MKNTKSLSAERRAHERAILRCLRQVWPLDPVADSATLPKGVQVEIIGLERARRRAGGKHR